MEKRDAVGRLNVIKLWESSAKDLSSLGLEKLDRHYCNGGAKRASTSRLQLVLLKAALLLGVTVAVTEVSLAGSAGDFLTGTGEPSRVYLLTCLLTHLLTYR